MGPPCFLIRHAIRCAACPVLPCLPAFPTDGGVGVGVGGSVDNEDDDEDDDDALTPTHVVSLVVVVELLINLPRPRNDPLALGPSIPCHPKRELVCHRSHLPCSAAACVPGTISLTSPTLHPPSYASLMYPISQNRQTAHVCQVTAYLPSPSSCPIPTHSISSLIPPLSTSHSSPTHSP